MFGHGCPYVRVTLSWMATHMASLAFCWVKNLGSKCEGKTLRPDHAGAQQPLKQKSWSTASNCGGRKWHEWCSLYGEQLRITYTWNNHKRMWDCWAALAHGETAGKDTVSMYTWYSISVWKDVALARMFDSAPIAASGSHRASRI